jgi:hypothetical protein
MTTEEGYGMSKRRALITLVACAAIAIGCGDEETDGQKTGKVKRISVAERHAQLQKDPYDLRCADMRDKVASARITRVVQYALADDAKIRGMTRLQASQSIYYAITELCKSKPGPYKPAKDAVVGVQSGEFRAEL